MMKNIIINLVLVSGVVLYGCSGNDAGTGEQQTQSGAGEAQPRISQAATMEEIWASDLDTSEKARRVQELLQASR